MEHKPSSWTAPIVTLVAIAAAIVLAFIGSGALGGTPINEAADGALSADATPFAPAGPAFSIWSVIYAGLVGYAIFQLLPTQRASARQAQLRPWATFSALLNAAWIGAVQLGLLFVSVAVIIVLLAVLVRILKILRVTSPTSTTDTLFTHGTFGLYAGWVLVATTANIAAWLATLGIGTFPGWELVSVSVLAVIAALGVVLAGYTRGYIAPALAISWGLVWVAMARIEGAFESQIIVWAAAIAAAVVLLSTAVIRWVAERQHAKSHW